MAAAVSISSKEMASACYKIVPLCYVSCHVYFSDEMVSSNGLRGGRWCSCAYFIFFTPAQQSRGRRLQRTGLTVHTLMVVRLAMACGWQREPLASVCRRGARAKLGAAGALDTRANARRRRKVAASASHRLPTSKPKNNKATSLAAVPWAPVSAFLHCGKPPTWARVCPSWPAVTCDGADEHGVDGELRPRPVHTTSMRRARWTGTSKFMADVNATCPTRVPTS